MEEYVAHIIIPEPGNKK